MKIIIIAYKADPTNINVYNTASVDAAITAYATRLAEDLEEGTPEEIKKCEKAIRENYFITEDETIDV